MRFYDNIRSMSTAVDIQEYICSTLVIPSIDTSFMQQLGGMVFVADNGLEVAAILKNNNNQFDSVTDYGDYMVCWVCNNNSGGPTYFLPKEFLIFAEDGSFTADESKNDIPF